MLQLVQTCEPDYGACVLGLDLPKAQLDQPIYFQAAGSAEAFGCQKSLVPRLQSWGPGIPMSRRRAYDELTPLGRYKTASASITEPPGLAACATVRAGGELVNASDQISLKALASSMLFRKTLADMALSRVAPRLKAVSLRYVSTWVVPSSMDRFGSAARPAQCSNPRSGNRRRE